MSAKVLRRGFGLVCLFGAIGLLIGGELSWPSKLSVPGLLAYWLTCFVLTVLAFVTALWDARIVRREAQAERQELFRRTFAGLGLEHAAGDASETQSRKDVAPPPPERKT
ncbi:MAG: hypothetical protein RMK20_04670 [Verrucomicrobiales bacterium]|nr:hypothetical protein [Verrucomicrobiales bacterium]